jgi:hypothetical protein
MKHPYFIELVLEGLIRDPKQRDALLGDLAEEYRARATRGGGSAANRWYAWQAARAVPHLARDAFRQTGWPAILVGIVVLSALQWATLILGFFTSLALVYPLAWLGVNPAIATIAWALGSLWSFVGGMIVARVFPRSPVPAAVVLAFFALIVAITPREGVEMSLVRPWYLLGTKIVGPSATLMGVLYMLHRRRRNPTATNPLPARG